MYERFTDQARSVLRLANDEATRRGHQFICPEHILLALLNNSSDVAVHLLQASAGDCAGLRQALETQLSGRVPTPTTPQAKPVMERAIQESQNLRHHHAGTEHLLIALLREPPIKAAFAAIGVDSEAVRNKILQAIPLNGSSGPAR